MEAAHTVYDIPYTSIIWIAVMPTKLESKILIIIKIEAAIYTPSVILTHSLPRGNRSAQPLIHHTINVSLREIRTEMSNFKYEQKHQSSPAASQAVWSYGLLASVFREEHVTKETFVLDVDRFRSELKGSYFGGYGFRSMKWPMKLFLINYYGCFTLNTLAFTSRKSSGRTYLGG